MSDLYTAFVSKLMFPAQERLKRHDTVKVRRLLEESQWWDRGRIERLQFERLQALLAHAQAHVPYYRELFGRIGFDAGKIQTAADLARLPFLGKAEIRANLDALKSEDARDLARFNTGGSSGEPLIFFIGAERVSHDVAAKWRATRWWEVDIGDPEIVVWGSPIELGAQDHIRRWRDGLMRTELLPAFEMSESRLDNFVERIRQRRPKMLFGYPSALSLIGRHAEARGQRMDDLGVKVAFCTSERLYDDQRSTIERIFGCRVANGYGGRDAGFIAHQCPSGGMHLTAEDIVVEIVDTQGKPVPIGESGEIVVTHLATRDFPFIRYRTGDVAALDPAPCACGRGLPLLKDIQGRTTDFVVARDGTVMHGLALIYVVRDLPQVAAFRIVQESLDLTRIIVVPADGYGPEIEARIRQGMANRLGQDVRIEIETAAEIRPEKSGKYRYVMSHVGAREQPECAT
ncbi:phenylacetate--CoA ligase family protein [Azoarcus sp. KH32C]|uniref:phenylacetate--CoA ligase family protein n=1 Tax=Azoarcus sp. KH32C TaxID=748247 RepID=UPI0002386899|nr:AMP-binding protein [Azoarcus sp. KH32C]BAL25897.1 capsular polysaccharide biosynthesis protein [Azoarcus sp. KH32C]